MKFLNMTLLVSVVFVSGCSSTPTYKVSLGANLSSLGELHLYRTNVRYHSLNPEKPFFYIDGKFVGKMGTGDSISIKVEPGNHIISVKDSIFFMPSTEKGNIGLKVDEKQNYYIRYSKEMTGTMFTVNGATTFDRTTFMVVNKNMFEKRE